MSKVEHIFVQKDLSFADGISATNSFSPSSEHLKIINKYTLEPVTADQVVAFPIRAMNNSIDRDWDMFSTACINKLVGNKKAPGPLGKPFICSHYPDDLANGRIYFAEKETLGQVDHLKLWVYIPNTNQYQDFIENILYGVYWAVSVGVSISKAVCSVCGVLWPDHFSMSCDNSHIRSQKYDGTLCYRSIEEVLEFYELSSVYLGAQYGAEVVKKMVCEEGRTLDIIRKAIKEVNDKDEEAEGVKPEAEIKSVVPFKSFPLADPDESWSFSSADGNELLGDPPDWKKFASAYTWFDEDNKEAKTSYKLPHHKLIDSSIKTVLKGVMAAGGALMGARGGASIPADEVEGCKAHLGKHYKEFDKTPPWDVSKIVALIDEGAVLELSENCDYITITKGKKVWEFDGSKIIRKEVRQMSEEMKKLQKDLETKIEEASAFETKLAQAEESLVNVTKEKDALTKELNKAKADVDAKEKVVEAFIEEKKAEVIRWYKLAKSEEGKEVDTTVLMRLLEKCGDDPELLNQLGEDFKEQAEKIFPPEVRRSSVEDTDGVEDKDAADKTNPSDTTDNGVANSIHG
jgi:hypothetical protein